MTAAPNLPSAAVWLAQGCSSKSALCAVPFSGLWTGGPWAPTLWNVATDGRAVWALQDEARKAWYREDIGPYRQPNAFADKLETHLTPLPLTPWVNDPLLLELPGRKLRFIKEVNSGAIYDSELLTHLRDIKAKVKAWTVLLPEAYGLPPWGRALRVSGLALFDEGIMSLEGCILPVRPDAPYRIGDKICKNAPTIGAMTWPTFSAWAEPEGESR